MQSPCSCFLALALNRPWGRCEVRHVSEREFSEVRSAGRCSFPDHFQKSGFECGRFTAVSDVAGIVSDLARPRGHDSGV